MEKEKKNNIDSFKCLWIFTIGSIFGWAAELVWFIVKWGRFQYNQGMVYGPFQQIYGFGAVILAFICFFTKNKNKLSIFIIGFLAFGAFEYISGWYLECFWDVFAWDYSRVEFSFTVGKYIYLPYCFIWGLFAIIWASLIQEPLFLFLNKFKNKKTKILTIILAVFFIFDIVLTTLATKRMTERINNIAPQNFVDKFVDKHYNNEYMQKWLPKIRIVPDRGSND